jgi:hypothetical protein
MSTDPAPSVTEIQNRALRATDNFMKAAADSSSEPGQAREWSLAAKNAMSVVLAAEQTIRTRNSHSR